ncbi:sigma 54-interacting transcriptional regulator [Sandaracinus amylolyticus]|uniref:Response regulator of zinc sigma-54-dependent two-component system n=1 Tax=Sandaracinus amylolyticus TaxID=927083 RepID=A0A0F6YLS7_9BACT|nr:sigma 54-interacting transcriptional regulator [Sandaracinus amylolyticus]AKF09841.1 Response regulator of zinc sigma-54-dependent two-component system [Sandaracinus amylolyticus]
MYGSNDSTERTSLGDALPIRSLRVVVIAGPEQGVAVTTEEESLRVGTAEGNDLVLADRTISRFHLEVRRTGAAVEVRDLGSTNGTRVGRVRLVDTAVEVELPVEIVVGATTLRVEDGAFGMREAHAQIRCGDLFGASPPMRSLFASLTKVAARATPVLVHGESGTGKELVARAIHDASPRHRGPFVVLDCGAISPALLASELFGHEKGAFTGAERRHLGVFERARGGTLFLDEIGELPSELQPALLGALERGRIRRVGGAEEIAIDVRVVSATHRDLRAEVNRNTFRLDLYYRLAVVTLRVPPLRERRDDVRLLIEHFLRSAGVETSAEELFGRDTLARFEAHAWPGNVRELRNAVEASIALGEPAIEIDEAPGVDGGATGVDALLELSYRDARARLLADFEQRYVRALLERAEWNVRRAARLASMDRSYLIDLMKKHGLS